MSSKHVKHLDVQYQDWFLEYASYVILERAVPHIHDGLKPVQRRILHIMAEMEDGYRKKVAKISGTCMGIHPHGDASINDAIVNLGQKNLLIDTQGNWGDVISGDPPAAPRYIEARLTAFAKETVFNPKTTQYVKGYDGQEEEPITLPVKVPLLLMIGATGIAVGLSCRILPHNFNELLDACISILRNEPFTIYPDFFRHGGTMDVSNYQDGKNGGKIILRAAIDVLPKNKVAIREIPFGETVTTVKDSIRKAVEKEKLKVKIDDLTGEQVEIIVTPTIEQSAEALRDALYAFTKCEVAIHPNAVVIQDERPQFIGVSDILRANTLRTKDLIKQELEIALKEYADKWHKLSLERLFIVHEAYQVVKTANTPEEAVANIRTRLTPYFVELRRPPSDEDILALTEVKIRKLSKYDAASHKKELELLEQREEKTQKDLANLTKTTIRYFREIKEKYGKAWPRKTTIQNTPFMKVEAASLSADAKPVFWNRIEGFIGTGNSMKKEEPLSFLINTLTAVVTINNKGTVIFNRIGEKTFFSENLIDARIYSSEADTPIYNLVYTNLENGITYVKRFQLNTGFTMDKAYHLAGGNPDNVVHYLYIQEQNQPAPKIRLHIKGQRKSELEFDFEGLAVKNREAVGNILSKKPIQKIKKA